ncbi:hypothetical protein ACWEN6_14040 [Sphaerisporangium sp. NPDC004334]
MTTTPEYAYLMQLCGWLAEHEPASGPWMRELTRKPIQGNLGQQTFFSFEPFPLYGAAHQAGLPLPTADAAQPTAQLATQNNALAAVLAVHATLSLRGGSHQAGGPALGMAAGSIPAANMSDTVANMVNDQVARAHSDTWRRLLHFLAWAEVTTVDLRTAAMLAYTVPGQVHQVPGHVMNPSADAYDRVSPASAFLRDFWRTRHKPAGSDRANCPGSEVEHCANCGRRSPQPGNRWWSSEGELVCGVDCADDLAASQYGSHYEDHLAGT